jgi:hypothetical protein
MLYNAVVLVALSSGSCVADVEIVHFVFLDCKPKFVLPCEAGCGRRTCCPLEFRGRSNWTSKQEHSWKSSASKKDCSEVSVVSSSGT